ncbi:MAG: hypothetical protein ACAI35_16030 [Candidatus Methylacidiphilales bacterium]
MNKLTMIVSLASLALWCTTLVTGLSLTSKGAEPDATAPASASADSALKPFPPYVAPVGENADWVMRILPAKEAATTPEIPAPAPAAAENGDSTTSDDVTEIHMTKVGDLQRAVVLRKDGTSTEYYHLKNFNLTPASDRSGKVMVVQQNAALPPYPCFAKGFFGVAWIRPENFAGVATYKEKKCFYYKGQQANPLVKEKDLPADAAGKAAAAQPAEAWVDCKTQLPVAVKIDNELVEFVHNPAAKQLELPPPYLAAWKFHENQQRRLNSMGVVR